MENKQFKEIRSSIGFCLDCGKPVKRVYKQEYANKKTHVRAADTDTKACRR